MKSIISKQWDMRFETMDQILKTDIYYTHTHTQWSVAIYSNCLEATKICLNNFLPIPMPFKMFIHVLISSVEKKKFSEKKSETV